MAKKRGEKRSAPPPPPLPAASSEETHSGAEESEDEEAVAVSRTPAPKNPPPPPQKGEESETSDEEEDDEEEEPSHAAPTTAPKNQPPAARQSEDSDSSDEEEDGGSESDKDAPPPKPSPKQEAKAPEAKKPRLAFHRIWSTNDEVHILEALAAHQKEPQPDALVEALAGKLDNRAYSSKELQGKVKSLKHRYLSAAKKYELPSKEHDRRLFDLSKIVWSRDKSMARAATAATAAATTKANNHEPKGFEEMCELYPYLAEEVKKLEAPGMFNQEFGKMDEEKARVLDKKIKKQRVAQMKVELRRSDLAREVTKAVMDLID